MNLDLFIENFADLLDETDPDTIHANTHFKKLNEWSSLVALSVIAMMDEEYDVQIEEADFKKLTTVQSVYDACTNK